jgi:hypothetical protein
MLKWPERILWAVGGAVLAAFLVLIFIEAGRSSSGPPVLDKQSESDASTNYGSQSPSQPHETFRERLTNDPTAASTVALAAFTFVLAWVAIIQLNFLARADDSANRQSKLANMQHFLTHRPHLEVRNIRPRGDPQKFGTPIEIDFEIINNGESQTIVGASAFEIRFVPTNKRYWSDESPKVGDPPAQFIEAGHPFPINYVWREKPFSDGKVWSHEHHNVDAPWFCGLFFMAKILYVDGNGQNRRLGIARRYDPVLRRFRPLGEEGTNYRDTDYEYDD